jgi:profilin
MSWQAYVDNNLIGTKKVAQGAIHGLDGNRWATSPGFNVTPEEAKILIKSISQEQPADLYTNGVRVGGVKYTFLRNEPNVSIYARRGTSGVCICKTGKAVLMGTFSEGMQPGQCNMVVENLANYLRNVGY